MLKKRTLKMRWEYCSQERKRESIRVEKSMREASQEGNNERE